MKQFLITVAGVLVGLLLFVVILPITLISMAAGSAEKANANPSSMVLQLDLREAMADQPSHSPFASFDGSLSTIELVRNLEAAGRDDAVKGLYIRANTSGMAPAQAEEIRAAIAAFRKSGKFVLTHVQNDGFETSIAGYASIAGSDEIWLQATGELSPMGLAAETTFLGGFFDKFKIKPEFEQRREYKNAVNEYTQKGFTPAHREATESLLNGVYGVFVSTIAADRRMSVEQARAALEGTPYDAAGAVASKLVDKLGRPEDLEAAALERAGAGAELVEFKDYEPKKKTDGPVIALVGGEGAIVTGPADSSPFQSDTQMVSDEIAKALLDAAEDDDVKAIIFRVSSPGGSAVASDQILNAVKLAQQKGKKVVVSMGEYAASGGYYVSASADAIVASPTTITGSIGIFGGKFVVGEAARAYLGVEADTVKVGSPLADMYSGFKPFTNSQREAFAAQIDRGYLDFKTKVSEGRKIPLDKVEEIARGRVWTGAQAKERGLVDELGGLDVAIARAKALAGLKPEQQVRLKLYPETPSPFEAFKSAFGASAESARAAAVLGGVLGDEKISTVLHRIAAEDRAGAVRAESEPVRVR
ncbi:MAG: signal peptide peptidase SppA [Alphaproteobacteria bacterium]|nr:signal peptide peptidase SppA [Alphaproteobacteria bacterium]